MNWESLNERLTVAELVGSGKRSLDANFKRSRRHGNRKGSANGGTAAEWEMVEAYGRVWPETEVFDGG